MQKVNRGFETDPGNTKRWCFFYDFSAMVLKPKHTAMKGDGIKTASEAKTMKEEELNYCHQNNCYKDYQYYLHRYKLKIY